LLGEEFHGNTFTCEPVNLIVHRLRLSPRGSTFVGHRADDEKHSEFLASTDNWFRPVQVKTGPDGCLWVVDMYRQVIEHPRWIPQEDLAKLDVRAGSTMGRIYRIRPRNDPPRPWLRLDKLDTAGLVTALNSPNGWQRDMAGQMLIWRNDKTAVPALERLARTSSRPEAQLHALCVLDGLDRLGSSEIVRALADSHPGVRRHAVRLSEKFFLAGDPVAKLVDDPDPQVRLQVAFSLADIPDSGQALAKLALSSADDAYLTAAVLSSVNRKNVADVLQTVLESASPPEVLVQKLVTVAAELGDENNLVNTVASITKRHSDHYERWQMMALAGILEATARQGKSLEKTVGSDQLERMLVECRKLAGDPKADEAHRVAAIGVLGRQPDQRDADWSRLAQLLTPQNSAAIQSAALASLGRIADDHVADIVISAWSTHSPTLKSQTLDLLLSRKSWQKKLMEALEKGLIPPAQIDAVRRLRLLENRDTGLRAAAAKLFQGATPTDRQKVVNDYRDVITMTGDTGRGKDVFGKRCSICHRLQDVGFVVGPDLAALANKSTEYLLISILDPSRQVDSRYIEYLATTKSGRNFTGILASETATSITLKGQEGKEQVLLRADLEELQSSGKSLMPEGLEKDLSKQDMADVMAYVAQAGAAPKNLPGNTPALVRAEKGTTCLSAKKAEIFGHDITFETPFQNIGCWHDAQDHVAWTVQLEKEGRFDVYLDYACDNAAAGNRFVLEGAPVVPPLTPTPVPRGTPPRDGWRGENEARCRAESSSASRRH
jgi:putative heme-binding domain-containing protein